jgi:ribosomal protein S27E
MSQAQLKQPYTVVTVSCSHCQQEQVVHTQARIWSLAHESVKCLKCEQEFQVTVSDAIVGGPFLPEPANSTGAKISGANFEGAEYDGDTLFPEGFDPKKHKMISKS